MNFEAARPIAQALLYEGYLLYPYRASALKNQQRFFFGGLLPRDFSEAGGGIEPHSLHCECLLEAGPQTQLEVRTRFLHLMTSIEAQEREVATGLLSMGALLAAPHRVRFTFGDSVLDGPGQSTLLGSLELHAEEAAPGVYKLSIEVTNSTPTASGLAEAEARLRTFASTHVMVGLRAGAFVSLLDPPPLLLALAAGCKNRGAWPVLIGDPAARDLLLCSPIILEDFPAIAAESPGDLCDGTEIDEMLRLRILTLSPEEQEEIRRGDARGRRILEQTLQLAPDDLLKLHGALREPRQAAPPPCVRAGQVTLRPGVRVRLRPSGRSDVFDLALAAKTATIASIEQDFEGRLYVTVILDDDPGRDLGVTGQPGHRFFFRPDEVEPLADLKEAR